MSRARIEELLASTIGLDPGSIGTQAIDLAVRARMRTRRISDLVAYCDLVEGDVDERKELLEGIVVSETWFFRDPQAFRFVVDHVASRLRSGTSLVRILSLPCATGEEPYSVVIALLEAGVLPEQVEVRGIDLSPRAVELARAGAFGANSFRGEDLSFRERWFSTAGSNWRIDPRVQACVSFEVANALGPTLDIGAGTCDVILCRNLLIYLNLESRRKLLGRIERALGESGVLIAGHSEDIAALAPRFRRSGNLAAFAYRRSEPPSAEPPAVASPPCESLTPRRRPSRARARARRAGSAGEASVTQKNAGAMLPPAPSADSYCLLGVTLRCTGKLAEAAACFERALYLDRDHYDSLVHFALLCEHRGEREAAGRLRRRAARVSRGGIRP
ncbi:MAG TPA: CheR family methyltransferase [Myxococcota bacterium]|nr:CheR family methyltransferase [Myxococcota bacterium]